MIRIVNNTHSNDKLSEACQLKVNFADPARPTISPLDLAQSYSEYYKMGVVSAVDVLLERDRDLSSREEALARLQQIKSETAALSPIQPVTQDVKLER